MGSAAFILKRICTPNSVSRSQNKLRGRAVIYLGPELLPASSNLPDECSPHGVDRRSG